MAQFYETDVTLYPTGWSRVNENPGQEVSIHSRAGETLEACHCEERSDVAISLGGTGVSPVRNDGQDARPTEEKIASPAGSGVAMTSLEKTASSRK
jgi:hypothetical protein